MSTTIFLVNPVNFGGATPFINDYSTLFDGVDEYVDNGRITMTEGATNLSLSFWLKMSTDNTVNFLMGRFGGTAQTSFYLEKATLANGNGIGISLGAGGVSPFYGVMRSNNAINFGAWNHIVLVFDGSQSTDLTRCKLYFDGVLQTCTIATGNFGSSINTDTTSFALGAIGGSTSNNMSGNLDEVSFFDYSLSASEVTDIYNGGVPTDLMTLASAKRPEHYYRMGDGDTFPTITDNGATGGNDGTMTNMESSDFVLDTP
jgi:hypothetical protein